MHRLFEVLQAFETRILGEAMREFNADSRNRPEKGFWRQFAAKPFQLRPMTGREHLGDRACDARADGGKGDQARATLA